MPKALRVCATPGCPALSLSSYCPACQAKQPKRVDTRAPASARGYGPRWRRYSKGYRAKHPWCRQCTREGRRSPTQVVDHIQPVAGPNDPKFWHQANHQPLCRSCHAVKTQAEGRTQQPAPAPPVVQQRVWRFA